MTCIILSAIVITVFAGVIARLLIKELRHVFRVPEGWAGLMYRHGLYVRRNNAGTSRPLGFRLDSAPDGPPQSVAARARSGSAHG